MYSPLITAVKKFNLRSDAMYFLDNIKKSQIKPKLSLFLQLPSDKLHYERCQKKKNY